MCIRDSLTIDQSIDFGSTAAAFSGGQGDFTVEFEPHATALEAKGDGYVGLGRGVTHSGNQAHIVERHEQTRENKRENDPPPENGYEIRAHEQHDDGVVQQGMREPHEG